MKYTCWCLFEFTSENANGSASKIDRDKVRTVLDYNILRVSMEGIFVDLICRSVPHCSDTGEHPEQVAGQANEHVCLCRPPRQQYNTDELGPECFQIGDVLCVRKDLILTNQSCMQIHCRFAVCSGTPTPKVL